MIAVGEGEELLADGRPGGHLELAHSADVGGFQAVFDLALDHARMPSWQAVEVADAGPNLFDGRVDDARNIDGRHGFLAAHRCCQCTPPAGWRLSMRLEDLSISLKKASCCRRAGRLAVERGRHSGMIAEEAGEISLCGKAQMAGDAGERLVRLAELMQRFLHA